MKRILVTGCKGYIGTVLCAVLRQLGHKVIGVDVGYFSDCLLEDFDENYEFYNQDIRNLDPKLLDGVDVVVHLAALSNDPLGEFSPELTVEINRDATIRLAKHAIHSNVDRFIYISSQSMYGVAGAGLEVMEDASDKSPITAYARTKWETELYLTAMDKANTCFTYLRPSTVFGYSPRLRSDIVFNNFIGAALTKGVIEIYSDGSPWRPVIHVNDVCNSIVCCIDQNKKTVGNRAYNLGIKGGNYTVLDLAIAANRLIPESELRVLGISHDPRSYMVSFDRLHNEFKGLNCSTSLDVGGADLIKNLKRISFTQSDFEGERTIRLKKLKMLHLNKSIDNNLRFIQDEI